MQGAGDTAIAALVLALRAGGSLFEAAIIANAASGIVVGKVGTATASADEVKAALPGRARGGAGPRMIHSMTGFGSARFRVDELDASSSRCGR